MIEIFQKRETMPDIVLWFEYGINSCEMSKIINTEETNDTDLLNKILV